VGRHIELDGLATTKVTFSEGRTFSEDVTHISLRVENATVESVAFHLPAMSAEATYHKSLALAGAWGLSEAPLHTWFERQQVGRRELADTMLNNTTMPVHLGIYKAYDRERRYRIVLTVAWMTEVELAELRAATQPATAPAHPHEGN